MHVVCWVVVLSLRVAQVQAGTDGAMGYFFEQQLVTGTAAELAQGALPVAIDAAGKLFPAVLKVGPLVHRGKAASSHYLEVYKWIAGFVTLGVPVLLVFDTLTGRYPPKAATHMKRAAEAVKHSADAAALDAAHISGSDPDADAKWSRVVHRETLRDLVHFASQVCTALEIRWVVAPFEADHECAFLSHTSAVGAVYPPHGDSDLPCYGIDTVLFRMLQNGNHSRLCVFELLGRVVHAKPTKANPVPATVDLQQVTTIRTLTDIVIAGGCDYFKTKGVAVPTAFLRMARSRGGLREF